MNIDLFGAPVVTDNPISQIGGLEYIPNYIDSKTEMKLIQQIDKQSWICDLKRRVQHYGYKYDYKARRIDLTMRIGQLPIWIKNIAIRLQEDGYFFEIPDQVIINEYLPGQGITPHIDCKPCFEDTIISISLGSAATMIFSNDITEEKIPILLRRRSLVVLKNESRFIWKHSIPARKSDKIHGKTIKRSRRVSLTFRKVIL